jgi:peptidoglycan-associated lipoprotein
MKNVVSRLLLVVALTITIGALSGGCAKKPVIPPESNSAATSSTAGGSAYPGAGGAYSENNLAIEGTLDDTTSTGGALGEQSDEYKQMHGRSSSGMAPVYFDFDQAIIRPDMADRMIQNAEYLKQVPNTVIVEGNCDDRGTKEYNLALGEKRAINVRDYLVNLGVEPTRIRTVSYGEERPLFYEQTDFAWSQNRRADFVIE